MRRILPGVLTLLAVTALLTLGVWQVQRRTWKLALIEQVDRRLRASPIPAPGPDRWARIGRDDAYTRVTVHGTFQNDRETLVQANTNLGPGFWVITPMKTDRGFTVLVNRGFVPPERKTIADRGAPAQNNATIATGLLRITEPKGGFLRTNDPIANRWYSRDVAAIAASKSLGTTAPYFIDADIRSSPAWPRGGLTVISFPNNHLVYAITWFAMAGLLAVAGLRMVLRRQGD